MATVEAGQQLAPEIPEGLEALAVPIETLKFHPKNARKHDLPTIMESLRVHGQYRAVVKQKSSGFVLAGNGTLEAALALGWKRLAATVMDVDDDRAARIVAVDNRANDLAGYDPEKHIELLKWIAGAAERAPSLAPGVGQLGLFEGSGYTLDVFETIMAEADVIGRTALEETGASHGETPEQYEERAQARSAVARAKGFKEAVLMFPQDEYDQFITRCKALGKHWGIESVSLTVLQMLRSALPPTPEEAEANFERWWEDHGLEDSKVVQKPAYLAGELGWE